MQLSSFFLGFLNLYVSVAVDITKSILGALCELRWSEVGMWHQRIFHLHPLFVHSLLCLSIC